MLAEACSAASLSKEATLLAFGALSLKSTGATGCAGTAAGCGVGWKEFCLGNSGCGWTAGIGCAGTGAGWGG